MSPAAIRGDHDGLEEEWEYEYDDHETEDIYFTLDLTTHVPEALVQSRQEANNEQATNIAATVLQSPTQPPLEQSASQGLQDDPVGLSPVQILDLHTTNPLVRFENNFYSCYWSTDLGTQFHVAKAGVIDNARYAGNVLDVIGISQTRLLGRPVSVQVRGDREKGATTTATPEHIADVDDSSDTDTDLKDDSSEPTVPSSRVLPAPGEPLVIPRKLCKTSAREDQAKFLECLSAIKLKKREHDVIAIHSVKLYDMPSATEQEAIRKKALEEDAALAKSTGLVREATTGEAPKKRRKRRVNPGVDPDSAAVESHKRIHGRSGRLPNADVRAGLGYQLEATAQESAPPQEEN